jgi:hypothetical protein
VSASDRVAVIAVHGIADQRAGQTVRELVRLLCHGGTGQPRYVQGEITEVLVPVARLEPGGAPSPTGTPSGFYQAQQPEAGGDARVRDLGVALNDYLLGRLVLAESEALYESTRISLRRRGNERPVDIFELYWADLSRLGTGGWRALSALYQLFFHLGTLAADIVDHVSLSAGRGGAWRVLRRMHAWLAWLMRGPAALIQLAMLLLVLFGVMGLVSPDQVGNLLAALFATASIGLTALAALAWLRGRSPATRWTTLLILLVAALACPAAVVIALTADRGVPAMYFAASAVSIATLGVWLIEQYARVTRGVRMVGHLLVGATALALWIDGRVLLPRVTTQAEWMLTAALNVGEWLLAALLLVWAVAEHVAAGPRRLHRALRCGQPGGVVDDRLRLRAPVDGVLLSARCLRWRLSLGRRLSRRPHPNGWRLLHADGPGVHGAGRRHAGGADPGAAGGSAALHERRCARTATRGGRLVGTPRAVAR